jgi:predicted extracellular nuclease
VLLLLLGPCALACANAQAACPSGFTPIHALAVAKQRSMHVCGVVTARFLGLGGYFIEAPRNDWDRDPTTSEGIFVYAGRKRTLPKPGTRVILAARPQDFHGVRELARPRLLARHNGAALPPAVAISLPLSRTGGWQALRGMRVRFKQALYVTGLDDAGRYGEIRLAAKRRLFAPTALTAPKAGAKRLKRMESARALWFDDGSSHGHPERLVLAGHRFDAAHPLRDGDEMSGLEGIAWHAFGRDLVEPTRFQFSAANPRRMPGGLGLPRGLRIVSFNVENYFNHALRGPAFPTERGARDAAGFACQTRKLVAALATLHPAFAGLEEIENDGYGADSALKHLVTALNKAIPDARYRYVRPSVARLGDGLIAPALVYDARRLAQRGKVAVLAPAALHSRAAAMGLARPALAASFKARSGGFQFTAAVVHLRSKLSACGDALDNHTGAGFCAGARAAIIAPLTHWLDSRPTGVTTPNMLVLGDFNSYPKERAIMRMRQSGWVNLIGRDIPADARYTETYRGRSGELDYIFASPTLASRVAGAAIWHNDADEERALSYRGKFAACGIPWRASDHDPVIAVLK